MKLENAIKTLSKHTTVENNGAQYWGQIGNQIVSFIKNGDDGARCFKVKRVGEENDIMTDYFCGSYYPNLKQAINAAKGV